MFLICLIELNWFGDIWHEHAKLQVRQIYKLQSRALFVYQCIDIETKQGKGRGTDASSPPPSRAHPLARLADRSCDHQRHAQSPPLLFISFSSTLFSQNYDIKIYTLYVTNYVLIYFRYRIYDIRMLARCDGRYFRIASSDSTNDTIIISSDRELYIWYVV